MREASMSLHSIAVLPPFKETPITNAQLHRFNRKFATTFKSTAPRWVRRRLVVTNGTSNRQEPSKELRLDQQDLMAIEFGRLLGESKDKTISKVLRRKIEPGSSYIEIEKKGKNGKGLINNADFVSEVERPGGTSRNGSLLDSDVPRLASPPPRPNGTPIGLRKIRATTDMQEIADDPLLRKPLSSQRSKSVSSSMSSLPPAIKSVKSPNSQRMAALEEINVDLNMLRRPSLEEESRSPRKPGHELKENNSSPSHSLQITEETDAIQASKLEFQRLLDEASPTSTTNVTSLLTSPSQSSTESTTLDGFELANLAATLPNLSSPPSRYRGTMDSFVQPAQARSKALVQSMKTPSNEVLDDSLLRKPGVSLSHDATTSPVLSTDEVQVNQDDQLPMPLQANMQPEVSPLPQLAVPPSRHTGTIGTFHPPGQKKIRGTQLRNKEPVDSSTDTSILRKPSVTEKPTASMVCKPADEVRSPPLSYDDDTQWKEGGLDNKLVSGPQVETHDAQVDGSRGYQIGGVQQDASEKSSQTQSEAVFLYDKPTLDNTLRSELKSSVQILDRLNDGNEAPVQQPDRVEKLENLAESDESLADRIVLDVSTSSMEEAIGLASTEESGEPKNTINSSPAVKGMTVAALKKPNRGLAFESMTRSNPFRGSFVDRYSPQDAKTRKHDIDKDIKTLDEVEENVAKRSSLDKPNGQLRFLPGEASSRDQERAHNAQEHLMSVPGTEHVTTQLDEASTIARLSANMEAQRNSVLQPVKALRRPAPLSVAELSTPGLQRIDLLSSNPKLQQAKEEEEKDWARAEALLKEKEQVEVKLIGSNSAGLFVSFGCLVGFLPSFELSAKRGLVDFATWAQQKGYDLSQRKTVMGAFDGGMATSNSEESKLPTATEGGLNELREKYKDEISSLLSSFVGEKTKVIVKLLDKGRRKLKVSEKEADPGCREHLQKKANLMTELKLGDVVTCQVKSITPIGVFVEVDGVPALIHQTEVSWNTRMDPKTLLSIGEVIKAKVCRLDRTLQRINLSLKQMQPDPLKRTLESVVGDLEACSLMPDKTVSQSLEMDLPELGDLLRKLEEMDQISSVSRGRCLYSAAFAPSFQVLISTSQSNGYKLLARFENKIQEIFVQTSLEREEMKGCIRLCTFSEA